MTYHALSSYSSLLFLALTAALLLASCAGTGEYLADRIEQETEERIRQNVDQGIEQGFDEVEGGIKNAVRCAAGDEQCIEQAQQEGKAVVLTDAQGNVVKQTPAVGAKDAQGVGAVNANYDFKPGERTIFAEDFSGDNVGDFPRSLEFRRGSMAVVEWQGGRALRAKTTGAFDVNLPEVLPERFTLTFDVSTIEFVNGMAVHIVNADGEPVGANYIKVDSYEGTGVASYQRGGISALQGMEVIEKRMIPIRVMADGAYVKVYVGTTRVANVPNAELGRTRTLRFDFYDVRGKPIYIADIRVAAGGRALYEALEAEGRVAVQDILFDTGEATIQPASQKALQEIATLLKEHSDLRLLIEGHTDNTGGYETNMTLSKERAAAVKTYLVEKHGIDGARLKTIGLGSTQPAASNDTEQGRAENRRVELVRL